jgi:hypothetical protein
MNNISAESFDFFDIQNYFMVKGNKLGVGADHVTPINGQKSYMLFFEFCGQGIVGGPGGGDPNYIANTNGIGLEEFWPGNITISKNSFFCNGSGIDYGWLQNRPAPFASINILNAGAVAGAALPNSTIELFYDDECPGWEGKTYIGSTKADNNGNWTYTIASTGAIVATATDTYGATSPYGKWDL